MFCAIDTTKVVTVKATAPNAEEEATADVAIFAYDEEGVRGEDAVATAADVEIAEGAIEVEFEGLETGNYVVVVTVGEEEAELDFAVDFDAADDAVEAVNDATNQIQLAAALENDYFAEVYDEANIVKYKAELTVPYTTVAEIIEDIEDINEEIETKDEFEAVKKALEEAHPNQLNIRNVLTANFDNVDAANIDAYETAIFEDDKVNLGSLKEIQEAIDGVNDKAAADAVVALIDKLPITENIELKDKEDVVAARAAYKALTEEQQALVTADKVTALVKAETDIENLEAYEAAKPVVVALFVDADADAEELELAEGVGQAEIDEAKAIVGKLEVKNHGDVDLNALVTSAETLFTDIQGRLEITSVSVANKLRDDGVYLLGYGVSINVNNNGEYVVDTREDNRGTIEDTESIVIQLYKGDTLLGEQTFVNYDNVNDSDKYTPGKSTTSGTIDVYGDYNSTSWDNVWYAGLTDIPDTAKAIVVYDDGRVVETEKEITVSDKTPFYVEALNRTETVADMSAAIVELEAAMKGDTKFTDLPSAAKLEVAEMVLDARNALETKKFALNDNSAYEAVTNDDGAIQVREAFIDGVNHEEEATISSMRAALTDKDLFPEFFALNTADKTAAAERVLDVLNAFEGEEKFETIAEIKAAAGL